MKKNTNKKPCCTEVQMGSNCDGVNDKKTKEEILQGLSSKNRECCDYNHRTKEQLQLTIKS
jgi:hypothetical protein